MFKNYLPQQYLKDSKLKIKHNYLKEQFSDYPIIFNKIKKVINNSQFTLGDEVTNFEKKFNNTVNSKYSIAVGSGTDAIFLSLKALDIGHGDEVITPAFSFYATVAAIVRTGAKPVFVDIGLDYNINVNLIENLINKKTKAILPIHWGGLCCDVNKINKIAKKYKIKIVYDACHSINSKYKGKQSASFGDLSCFSFHPLKNLNIWGDGGIITTNSYKLAKKLNLLRNHGLINRNECEIFGYNSRLDTIQAVIASHMLNKINSITNKRIKNANFFDKNLAKVKGVKLRPNYTFCKNVYHIYQFTCKNRNKLLQYLISNKIDAKIHYPNPIYLQKASKYLGYKKGDFPQTEKICSSILSIPVHEFISKKDKLKILKIINQFYNQ